VVQIEEDVMAFADTPSGRVNPKSLGATLMINGAIIATIATMMPGGIAKIDDFIPIVDLIREPTPPPPPEPPQTRDTKDVKQGEPTHVTVPPSAGTGPTTDNDIQIAVSGGDIIIPGEGTGTTIIDPPPTPPIHQIVRTGARPDPRFAAYLRADRPDFFDTTRDQALRKWRFTPATEDGTPVESWREMTVKFEMPEGA
jgi:periplasmic protein TonB